MPKQEILPPLSRLPTTIEKPRTAAVTARVPDIAPQYGEIGTYFATRRYENASRAADALTRLNNSETALVTSQTALVKAVTQRGDELFRMQEAPERRAHELDMRRLARANEMAEGQHSLLMHAMRRRSELTLAEAEYTDARATLNRSRAGYVDSEQQLDAQKKYGALNHELGHAEQNLKRLDIQLSEKERRALLNRQLRDIEDAESEAERMFRKRMGQIFDSNDGEED